MKRRLLAAAAVLAVLCAGITALVFTGRPRPDPERYPVRGVDVSSYQGSIDWPVLSDQGIEFAWIKATEGSGTVDPCFAFNFEQAQKTGLRVGAYHFFSYDSAGATQAERFIVTVPKTEGMLPPVVDVEFYGDYWLRPPDRDDVTPQLTEMLRRLREHYGVRPVLYATARSYRLYL